MKIESLYLQDFRNYETLRLDLAPGLNVFVGENAAGKTNILEAAYLLSTARSHRGSHDAEMVRWGQLGYSAGATVIREALCSVKVGLRYSGEKRRKTAVVEGLAQPSIGAMLGKLNTVVFSPDDMDLFKGGPSTRRRYIDRQISQIDTVYYRYLVTYHRVLAQRNALLRDRKSATDEALETWDEQLAEAGAKIIHRRQRVISDLDQRAREFHYELAGTPEKLTLAYSPSVKAGYHQEPGMIRSTMAKALNAFRRREIARGVTLIGPHRDDIRFCLEGSLVEDFGSQGQRRTTVLSLKLAEVDLMEAETGERPVLLLDDVASELDPTRREFLVRSISGRSQVVLTTTSLEDLGDLGNDANLFSVRRGQVSAL
ncbi:MAG: DNA replication/repair protein RecF [Bacillota bacterium]